MSINATPFNPTFKLVDNLQDEQVLVYSASEGAFVNAAGSGSGGSNGGIASVNNTGIGAGLGTIVGSSLELKSIVAGTNVTVTDNGTALVISASFTETNQTGTNLGTGSSLLANVDEFGTFGFKSIATGTGLTITDDGSTITLSSTVDDSLYNLKAQNLADVADASAARTNIGAISQADGDERYLRLNAHNTPTINDTFDLGSSLFKYSSIHATTLHGTALLADNLTITGSNIGDVLTWNGTTWVASAAAVGDSDVPQTLIISGQTLSISGGNSITLPTYDDVDNFIKTDGHSLPSIDSTWDIGSSEKRYNDIYAESFRGTATLANNLTVSGTTGDVLTYNGATWVSGPDVKQALAWDGNVLTISDGNSVSLNLGDYATTTAMNSAIAAIVHPVTDWSAVLNKPTIPADVSELTDTTNLLVHPTPFSGAYADLTDTPTIPADVSELTDTTNLLVHPTPFSGDYNDLTNTPTIPTITGLATEQWVNDQGFVTNETDSQTLQLAGSNLSISSGNSIDLSSLLGNNQTLTLADTTLTISDGNSIDLSVLQTPAIDLTPYATTNDLNAALAALPSDSDSQTLTFNGTTLSISSGNAVDLASLVDLTDLTGYATETFVNSAINALIDTDGQLLTLNGTRLTITGGNYVELADAIPTADSQTLALNGTTLSISGGNSITLPIYNDVDNYIKLDGHSAPSVDNTWDIGSAELRFNDVYGERFHGTAILADNLTVSGNALGEVLTWNGSTWVSAPTGAGSGGNVGDVPQSLSLSGTDLTISGGNSVDLSDITGGTTIDGLSSDVNTNTLTIEAGWDLIPATDGLQSLGSPSNRYTEIYIDNSTINIGGNAIEADANNDGNLLWNTKIVATQEYVQSVLPTLFSGSYDDLTDKPTLFDGTWAALSGKPTIPSDVSNLTDTTNLLSHALAELTDVSDTAPELHNALVWDNENSTWKPGMTAVNMSDNEPSSPDAGELWLDSTTLDLYVNYEIAGFPYWIQLNSPAPAPDYQSLSISGTTLSIANGNSVDLSGIGGSGSGGGTTTFSEAYNAGVWDFNLIPETTATFDIGSPNKLVRHLYISDNSIYMGTSGNTLRSTGTTLLFNDEDVKDYTNLINKPAIPTDISDLTDSTGIIQAANTDSQSLTLVGSNLQISGGNSVDLSSLGGGVSSWNDLTDKPTTLAALGVTDAPADISDLTDTAGLLSSGSSAWDDITDTPTTLAGYGITDGGSSAWDDITGKPTIPVDITDLTDTTNLLAHVTPFSGEYADLTGAPTIAVDINELTDTDGLLIHIAAQTLTLDGTDLTISDGNTIDLSGLGGGGGSQTLSVDGNTISISGSNSITLPVYTDVDNYIKLDGHSAPSEDNTWDIGSAELRFNDIYAERFHGTAVLADNLTIEGTAGQVLTHNGTAWVAADSSAGGGGSEALPQSLSLNGTNLTISSSNTIDLITILPSTIDDLDDVTVTSTVDGQVLTYNNVTGEWENQEIPGVHIGATGPTNPVPGALWFDDNDMGMYINYDIGLGFSTWLQVNSLPFSGDYADLTGVPTIPADINELADADGLLSSGSGGVTAYADLTGKPTIPVDITDLTDTTNALVHNVYTQGTGIQINSKVVSLTANLGNLLDVASTSPATGQVLGWTGSQWEPRNASADANLSNSSIGELNNVNISGIQSGQYLEWNGTSFVATSASAADISGETLDELSNVSSDVPVNGDVLTWDSVASEWGPAAASGGGGGGGDADSRIEYFKLNYNTNGTLKDITNATSGISATIVDSSSGETDISFSGYTFPPSNILIYGYSRQTNEYIIMPLNKDMATRKLAAGGSAGSPAAFGAMASLPVTLLLREADTGANRSFGTDTHAWIVVSMI